MSYDFHLLSIAEGQNPVAQARAYLDSTSEDDVLNAGPADAEKERRKQALVAVLRTVNPELEVFPFDYGEIARVQGLTEADARARFRHVELNGPEDGNGVQIELFDHTASVTVPYWHHGGEAEGVFDEIWRYLSVLERDGGYRTYDPQLDRVLDLGRDRAAVLDSYARGLEVTFAAAKELIEPKRPWWRFWTLLLLATLPALACASGHTSPPAASLPVCAEPGLIGVVTKEAGLPGIADTLRTHGVGGATPAPVVPEVSAELKNREEVRAALIRYYPQGLKDQGISGEVHVAALIDPDGRVARTWIRRTSGVPELDQAAVQVVRLMVFTPAVYRGCRIRMWAALPLIFRTIP